MTAKAKKPPSKKAPVRRQKEPDLKHPCPPYIGAEGRVLWNRLVGALGEDWNLDERELALLEEAAKTADELGELGEALDRDGMTVTGSRGQPVLHPAVGEIRQMRTLLLRLLGSIELSDPIEAVQAATPEQAKKRRAASARWARESRRLAR